MPKSRAELLVERLRSMQASAPDIEASAVVSVDGLIMASALQQGVEEDRVSAMSAAMLSLGERISGELGRGGLELSGGQQQRLCIARVLAVVPEVLLMDEPCSAIDPTSVQKVEDLMGELKDRITIVIVTHNMQQAARVSDFTAFFLQEVTGKPAHLIEYDRTAAIFTSPKDRRTEDYITGRFG